ncbi:hypothetical protein SDC9_191924 [bioreactor metagenome]|uniref:Uncharacterized protein n=1 Tax=bioreactor metagenome TaxID=1076179 RepID=A0A645I1Q9_9ZZZZ
MQRSIGNACSQFNHKQEQNNAETNLGYDGSHHGDGFDGCGSGLGRYGETLRYNGGQAGRNREDDLSGLAGEGRHGGDTALQTGGSRRHFGRVQLQCGAGNQWPAGGGIHRRRFAAPLRRRHAATPAKRQAAAEHPAFSEGKAVDHVCARRRDRRQRGGGRLRRRL